MEVFIVNMTTTIKISREMTTHTHTHTNDEEVDDEQDNGDLANGDLANGDLAVDDNSDVEIVVLVLKIMT